MTENAKSKTRLLLLCRVLYFLLPLPVTWFAINLMGSYMKYYDIGVNVSANHGFLMFFVAPALLVSLLVIAAISLYLLQRLLKSPWWALLLGSILVVSGGSGAFIVQARSNLDYPSERPQDISLFLRQYVAEMGNGSAK